MKLLKLTTAYPIYIHKFYRARPGLASQTYVEQKKAMDYDAYGWSDFWSHALNPLGYDVQEITVNIKTMQYAWARDNNFVVKSGSWFTDIAYEQIKRFDPDILFVEDSTVFPLKWLRRIRDEFPSIRLFITWCGAPYRDANIFHVFDLILSCIPEMVDDFISRGHDCRHINHAFDPRVLERIQLESKQNIQFSFVGQIARGNKMHVERGKILQELSNHLDVEIFSPAAETPLSRRIKDLMKNGASKFVAVVQRYGLDAQVIKKIPALRKLAAIEEGSLSDIPKELRKRMKESVFGLEMFQTLRNSKMTFNNHIDISPRSASNMRLFEATGVGTCLVTDWKPNIGELFVPDGEVVTYKTTDECIDKVKWLLKAETERSRIAKAGQARTLRDHTFKQRADIFHMIISQKMKEQSTRRIKTPGLTDSSNPG